ncbi:MAG: hypothetical protein WD294_00835 [Phycisphaeraceae bacterium]
MNDYQGSPPPKAGMSPWLSGCLIVVVLLLVLGGVGSYFAYHQFRAFMADMGRVAAVEVVRDSHLDADDQEAMIVEIDRMVDGFQEGTVALADLHQLFDELQQQGTFDYLQLMTLHREQLRPALSDDAAVADARQQVERIGQGLASREIRSHQLDSALDEYFVAHADTWEEDLQNPEQQQEERNRWEPRNPIDSEAALAVTESLRQLADDAEVAPDAEPVHLPTIVREAVDNVLGSP